jgi:D-lactate dehydrogenase (cytochrome)
LLPSNTLNHFFPFLYLLEAYTREQTQIVQQIASKHNGSDFMFAEEPEAKKELWKIRKEALWACYAMAPGHEAMITVCCFPSIHFGCR